MATKNALITAKKKCTILTKGDYSSSKAHIGEDQTSQLESKELEKINNDPPLWQYSRGEVMGDQENQNLLDDTSKCWRIKPLYKTKRSQIV